MLRRTSVTATAVVAAVALCLSASGAIAGPRTALAAPSAAAPSPAAPSPAAPSPAAPEAPDDAPDDTGSGDTPADAPADTDSGDTPDDAPADDVQADDVPWPQTTGLPGRRIPVWPGLGRHQATVSLRNGHPAVVNILDYDPAAGSVQLRPELAQGTLRGLESVPATVQRLAPVGAIAGVNGGFWLNNPVGDPNGYFAQGGALLSEAQTQGAGPRGTYARRTDGTFLIDRLDSKLTLSSINGDLSIGVRGLNRLPSQAPPYADLDSSAFLYTPAWGGAVDAQPVIPESTAIRTLVIDGLRPPAGSGTAQGVVRLVSPSAGEVAIPADGAVLVTMGGSAGAVEDSGIAAGDTVELEVELDPLASGAASWTDIVEGVAAGPLLVKDGEVTEADSWSIEGFAPEVHSNVRAPRSAMGVTADGHVLLVTVDGRQPGYSAGMTMAELAAYLVSLGAVDAMSLDGGASSQFVADGVLRNRPCCDRSLRPVADSLVLFRDPYEFVATRRLAGSGREATAAAIAASMHPDGTDKVVLASGGSFPDALAGGPLAVAEGAALLLTAPQQLSAATQDALDALRPSGITILGGTSAISTEVEETLESQGYTVTRVSGRDRIETAAAVAARLAPAAPRAFLAAAGGFADALSAASPAGMLGAPILLSGVDSLPEATREALLAAGTAEVMVVGGTDAIGDAVVEELQAMGIAVTRLAGTSRFGTAAAVNRWAQASIPGVQVGGLVVAVGGSFPDALAGGPLAASLHQLLMLVPRWDVTTDPDADAYLRERDTPELAQITLLGGTAVLTDYQRLQLDQLAAPAE